MITDPAAPTAPIDDFLQAYRQDDNWWWRIGCGHHQNLFEAMADLAGVDLSPEVASPLVW